jgi:hypothetical protein
MGSSSDRFVEGCVRGEGREADLLRKTSSELDHAGLDHLFVVLALAQDVLFNSDASSNEFKATLCLLRGP